VEFKPHSYQAYAINRIVNDDAVGLFLRPGLGKTSITLSAINILKYFKWSVKKVLVVAPKKVAEGTWSKEASKWDHLQHLRVATVLGSSKERIKALNTVADVYVINRENIPWLVDYYKQEWPFDMVVLDESTSFKNPQSKRFKALKLVRRFMKKVVLLTGTPSSKGIEDLWSQIYLLDEGKRLGKTITAYRQTYFNCNTHGGHFTEYTAKPGAADEVLNAINDICISMTADDYLELPDLVKHEIPVVLDVKTKKAYKQFERDLLLEIDGDTVTAQTAGVLTGKLLQFCSGAIYNEDKEVLPLHDCKLDAYMELIERLNGEPCITFYGFQHDKDRLLAALAKTKLRVRLYNDTADEDDWNTGKIDVLLVHPASCGYGLNLQAGGQHIIWFTPNWSFELNDQSICRLHRQGSPYDKIYVHYLVVQGGVDEDVIKAVQSRDVTHQNVMNVLKARIKKVKELM
jgi:SNF2 family DNA or RNA helicase